MKYVVFTLQIEGSYNSADKHHSVTLVVFTLQIEGSYNG